MKATKFFKWSVWVIWLLVGTSCHDSKTYTSVVSDMDGCAAAPVIAFSSGAFFEQGELEALNSAAYFRIEVPPEGAWYQLETENALLPVYSFDPVLSLLSADGSTPIGSVDDSLITATTDSFYVYYAPGGQSLCVKLESYQNWTESSLAAQHVDHALNYAVRFMQNSTMSSQYDVSAAGVSNDTTAEATHVAMVPVDAADTVGEVASADNTYSFVHGRLDSVADADVYAFTTGDAETISGVSLNMRTGAGNPLSGISGSGTTATVQIEILDSTEQLIASMSMDRLRRDILANLSPQTTYFIRVSGAPGWTPGANDFYSLYLFSTPSENFAFEAVSDNDSYETAELLALEPTVDGYQVGSWLGTLDELDTVDVFRIELSIQHYLLMFCTGATMGSGIQNFTVTAVNVTSGMETELQSGVESDVPIEWSDGNNATASYILLPAGTTYLQVTGVPSEFPSSHLYYCSLALAGASK
ncbi:MAG: hypothetical protein JXX29_09205 [Deltaproteobacteria bacterium]|nr:hypothetical protein [Deltaproteobacteria bacterium]MBN2671840.1 hypothetical protein [Deltaproteobacteria bacterium]